MKGVRSYTFFWQDLVPALHARPLQWLFVFYIACLFRLCPRGMSQAWENSGPGAIKNCRAFGPAHCGGIALRLRMSMTMCRRPYKSGHIANGTPSHTETMERVVLQVGCLKDSPNPAPLMTFNSLVELQIRKLQACEVSPACNRVWRSLSKTKFAAQHECNSHNGCKDDPP